jgi:putative Holliday junction resolvase
MPILALDIGDRWIGVAISDPLRIIARPYTTIERPHLHHFIAEIIIKENIALIIVGYPKTLRGTESKQTKLVVAIKEELETAFPTIAWQLCDERFSSKNATALSKAPKAKEHARAAAFILTTYLNSSHNKINNTSQ